jgi:hypothetical protein
VTVSGPGGKGTSWASTIAYGLMKQNAGAAYHSSGTVSAYPGATPSTWVSKALACWILFLECPPTLGVERPRVRVRGMVGWVPAAGVGPG